MHFTDAPTKARTKAETSEEKRHHEQRRVRRIIIGALGVSVLLHGALWGASHWIQAPLPRHETLIEVTLSPQPTKAPRLVQKPRPTPKPTRQKPERTIRHRQKPTEKRQFTRLNSNVKARPLIATRPQPKFQAPKSTFSVNLAPNPLKTPDNPRNSQIGNTKPNSLAPNRKFGGGLAPFANAPHENEIASLPQGNGESGTSTSRGPRHRGSDTQVYLPNPKGTQDGTAGNNSTNPDSQPRPSGLQTENSRSNSENSPSSGRIARQPSKFGSKSSKPIRPDSPRPYAPREEAPDNAPTPENNTRQPRMARRTNSGDGDLFPTPPQNEPKEPPQPGPQPGPQPEPDRELFRPAKVRSAPKPDYPAEAKAKNQEGTVVVRLQISEAGRVTEASIVTSSGISSLDEASLRGVRRWTYEPARRGKIAVASSTTARLRWRLTD